MNIIITRQQIFIFLIILGILLAAGLLARHFLAAADTVAYITANAARMDIEEKVLASGTLNAYKTVAVGAQVSGQLKKLHVALGDQVRKGQLLAAIDPILQQNTLRDAEAQVENLKAQRDSRLAMLKQYKSARQRQQEMFARDAAARADLEGAQAQFDSTRSDIAALEAQIRKARIAVATARANLEYTRIVAPMDGVVISIVTEEGQTVVSAQSAPTILKLADLDTITVKAQISEADITRVRPGQSVYFTTLGDAETRHYGRLRAIEPGPDSSSSSGTGSSSSSSSAIYYNGLFEVANPDRKLRVSMTAQVSIVLNRAGQALCIPATALGDREKNGRHSVRVLVNNRPETVWVRTGIGNSLHVQILEGLREGDRVIIGDSSTLPAVAVSTQPGPPPGGRR